jgi:hypothetical protein
MTIINGARHLLLVRFVGAFCHHVRGSISSSQKLINTKLFYYTGKQWIPIV